MAIYQMDSKPPQSCEIMVRGHLAARCSEWFDGLALTHTESGHTIISGQVESQAALRSLVATVLDQNLTLVSVNWVEPEPLRPWYA